MAISLPRAPKHGIRGLADCQRRALAGVRSHCTRSHEAKLPEVPIQKRANLRFCEVQERFQKLGFTGRELETTLGHLAGSRNSSRHGETRS